MTEDPMNELMHDPDLIFWSKDYRLKWEDYQGVPEAGSRFGAITNVSIHSQCDTRIVKTSSKTKFQIFDIKVVAMVIKSGSWVNESQRRRSNQELILKHEQGHFDYGQILATKLSKKLHDYADGKSFTCKGMTEAEQKIFADKTALSIDARYKKEIENESDRFSKKYDFETNYGQNPHKQEEYNRYFDRLLK